MCDQLAFSGEEVDWQIWIENGATPLPRKLVIHYKMRPGSPQYQARIRTWDLSPMHSAKQFEFVPPAGAERIEMVSIAHAAQAE